MTDKAFESVFANWKQRAISLNQGLYAIVHAEVDINADDWYQKLKNSPHPADESKLREEIESLFGEIIALFESFDSDQRQQIIDLMKQNDSLMYSAVIDSDMNTPDGFRKNMILVVLQDQGLDPRDFISVLTHFRQEGEKNGIDVDSIFEELAAIASTRDKYGWGATRDLFLKY